MADLVPGASMLATAGPGDAFAMAGAKLGAGGTGAPSCGTLHALSPAGAPVNANGTPGGGETACAAAAHPTAVGRGVGIRSPHASPELERMLRNFRLRRRLGLLPGSQAPVDALALRWVRHSWRPQSLAPPADQAGAGLCKDGAEAGGVPLAAARRSSEMMNDVAEMQLRLESGYSELNAERRSQGALAEGLRRQGESVAAIAAESAQLRAQLERVRQEVQDRVADNGRLSVQLGLQRQSQASGLTQAALLASAVSRLDAPPAAPAGAGAAEALEELVLHRVQIAALVEENELLERRVQRMRREAKAAMDGDAMACGTGSTECLATLPAAVAPSDGDTAETSAGTSSKAGALDNVGHTSNVSSGAAVKSDALPTVGDPANNGNMPST